MDTRKNRESGATGVQARTRTGQAREPAATMRASLLELAKEHFAKRGYVDASLRDLAEFAGVTAAAVYYHFSKKEDLLREIVFEGLERLSERVVGALAGAGSPEERLEAVVRAHLRYNVDFPREARIIIEESRFLNEVDYAAARERQMAVLNAYRACVRQLLASGRIANVEPGLVAFGIISVIGGWYRWYRPDGPVPKEQAFEYMVGFAMAGALHGVTTTAS